ncbi:MAG TPA: NAD(+) synthase [Bacillales bacterium]|nr:NAD(+) synthase [Bacillales bacterium]
MKQKIEQLVSWLQEQVKDAGLNGAIVGISGGIDSAVVAYLIQKAFPNDSMGVIMPCKSNPKDQADAMLVVQASGIKALTIDLTETHQQLFTQIQDQLKGIGELNENSLTLGDANLRARLRMSTLYTVANNYRYLVIGTDNAAEWYTGYFTKYGDGGVDLVPLIHLTKGEVREMAEKLGVPEPIITKSPSAGLWEGQTDENEMGTTYDTIDRYLNGEEILEKDREIIERLHRRSEHKRNLAAHPPKF